MYIPARSLYVQVSSTCCGCLCETGACLGASERSWQDHRSPVLHPGVQAGLAHAKGCPGNVAGYGLPLSFCLFCTPDILGYRTIDLEWNYFTFQTDAHYVNPPITVRYIYAFR